MVDEASQITLPTCLGPLRYADRFLLVGDHFQLPPLVKSSAAKGMEVSLFRRLSDAHPEAVVTLGKQYRMNEDIMGLSNALVYSGRMACGNEEVARRKMIDGKSVVFYDTQGREGMKEQKGGDGVWNDGEACLVKQYVEDLLRQGVKEDQIGVISLYRQQVKLLSHHLSSFPGVEVLTADRAQGRDKDCIIISMVRSNEDGKVGELVRDWRRLNVCFTRAKCKLVFFGNRKTLEQGGGECMGGFFGILERAGWFERLGDNNMPQKWRADAHNQRDARE